MTVELEKTTTQIERYGPLGILRRKVSHTTSRVAEYRSVTQEVDGRQGVKLSKREAIELVNDAPSLVETKRIMQVISPDSVKVASWWFQQGKTPEMLSEKTYNYGEIIEANLVTVGEEKVLWRHTQPEDYPEIKALANLPGELVYHESAA